MFVLVAGARVPVRRAAAALQPVRRRRAPVRGRACGAGRRAAGARDRHGARPGRTGRGARPRRPSGAPGVAPGARHRPQGFVDRLAALRARSRPEADRAPPSGTLRYPLAAGSSPGCAKHVRLVSGRFPSAPTERVEAPVSQPVSGTAPRRRSRGCRRRGRCRSRRRALDRDRAAPPAEARRPGGLLAGAPGSRRPARPDPRELPLAIRVTGLFVLDTPERRVLVRGHGTRHADGAFSRRTSTRTTSSRRR